MEAIIHCCIVVVTVGLVGLVPWVKGQTSLPIRWRVQDYPNPRYQPQVCGLNTKEESLICDPNTIITTDEAKDINEILKRIHSDTRCGCQRCRSEKTGYTVMVALVPQMHRIVNASNELSDIFYDARVYAYYLSLYWSRNFAICEEFVILLYDQAHDIVYTLTQRNARIILTDEKITEITMRNRRYFVPDNLNEKRVGKGLMMIVQSYYEIFKGMEG